MLARLARLLGALERPGVWRAALSWPKFSLASFLIVSRLKQHGVAPATVVDVGANVGQFAVASAKLFRGVTVISVEPDPQIAKQLKENVKRLPVDVVVVALGEQTGQAAFHVNRDSQVSSLLPLGSDRECDFPDSKVIGRITVNVETLDTLFSDRILKAPILLKLDVQGFEEQVLRGGGAFLQRVQWVVVEVAFGNLYEGEADFASILKLLEDKGLIFTRPVNWFTSPRTGEVIEMDALFTRSIQ